MEQERRKKEEVSKKNVTEKTKESSSFSSSSSPEGNVIAVEKEMIVAHPKIYTVNVLKKILSYYDLPKSGLKNELTDQIFRRRNSVLIPSRLLSDDTNEKSATNLAEAQKNLRKVMEEEKK